MNTGFIYLFYFQINLKTENIRAVIKQTTEPETNNFR